MSDIGAFRTSCDIGAFQSTVSGVETHQITSTATIVLTATSAAIQDFPITATAAIVLTSSVAAGGTHLVTGTVAIVLTASAGGTRVHPITGTVAIVLTISADVNKILEATSTAAIVLTASSAAIQAFPITSTAAIVLAASAAAEVVEWVLIALEGLDADFAALTGTQLDITGVTKLGDGGSNYTQVSATGLQTMAGTARVKQQIPIDNANLGKGATKANQVILGNYNAWEFGINDDSVFTFHLPHEWATGTDITVNIDWYINEAGGDEIKWEIAWSATPHDSNEPIDNPTHTGSSDTGDIIVPGTVKFFTTNSLTIGGASLSAGDQVGITLKRIAITDGANPANEPAVVDVHIEYLADKLGEAI